MNFRASKFLKNWSKINLINNSSFYEGILERLSEERLDHLENFIMFRKNYFTFLFTIALFLAAAGVAFAQPLKHEPWGARDFIVRDPDGNLVLFAGPAK